MAPPDLFTEPSDPSDKKSNAGAVPEIPPGRHDLRVLTAIRRIIRAADLYSHRLASQQGITVPQLLCLSRVVESGGISIKCLAREIYLSPSTIVGIIDRLESRGLVTRSRSTPDKRVVQVVATPEGREAVRRAPAHLHGNLVSGFRDLPEDRQRTIAEAMETLVQLMEIDQLDAAPILETRSSF